MKETITVLLLINVFLIGFVTTTADALQNNLSGNYSDTLSRPLPISDDISRFIPLKKDYKVSSSPYPVPLVKPNTSTSKSLGITTSTSSNSLNITSLNYTNLTKPNEIVNP